MPKPAKINIFVDIAMFAAFIPCAYSGAVIFFLFRPPACPSHLGLDYYKWHNLHIWSGWALIALVILHLILHIKWILDIPKMLREKND